MSKLEPTRTSSDLTATEHLRELLDERGIEYEVDDAKTVRVTRWRAYGDWVSFIEYDNGDTKFCIDARRLTPEQAIAATLGSCNCSNNCTNGERTGTCHNVWDIELTGRLRFQCSECGAVSLEITPNFCPVCGRRVEVDE